MSKTDPIAEYITFLRNAGMAKQKVVRIPSSWMRIELSRILKEEGYIEDFNENKDEAFPFLAIKLKYKDRTSVIHEIQRESKPGRRKYVSKDKIYSIADGYGTLVLSTSKGVMTGFNAQKLGIGGEPLIRVW